jgi:hypothetical protein
LPEVTRRSALVANQMKHIPKPFNNEQAEKFLVKGAYRTSCMVGFVQHPGGKAISDLQTHYRQYKERREIGVLLFSRPPLRIGPKDGLTSELGDSIVKLIFFISKRP